MRSILLTKSCLFDLVSVTMHFIKINTPWKISLKLGSSQLKKNPENNSMCVMSVYQHFSSSRHSTNFDKKYQNKRFGFVQGLRRGPKFNERSFF